MADEFLVGTAADREKKVNGLIRRKANKALGDNACTGQKVLEGGVGMIELVAVSCEIFVGW